MTGDEIVDAIETMAAVIENLNSRVLKLERPKPPRRNPFGETDPKVLRLFARCDQLVERNETLTRQLDEANENLRRAERELDQAKYMQELLANSLNRVLDRGTKS